MNPIIPGRTLILRRNIEVSIPGFDKLNKILGCRCLVKALDSDSADLEVIVSPPGGPSKGEVFTVDAVMVSEPYFDVPKWVLTEVQFIGFAPSLTSAEWYWAKAEELVLGFQTTDRDSDREVVVMIERVEVKRKRNLDGTPAHTVSLSDDGVGKVQEALVKNFGQGLSPAFAALINVAFEQGWDVYNIGAPTGGLKLI